MYILLEHYSYKNCKFVTALYIICSVTDSARFTILVSNATSLY